MTEVSSAAGTAVAASSTGIGFPAILSMVITLVTAYFTGGGMVTAEQEAALNAASPGLGSAFASAVTATNGAASSMLEWKAKTTIWDFIAGDGGVIDTVWSFIKEHPFLVAGGAWVVFRLLSGSSLLPSFLGGKKKSSNTIPYDDSFYDDGGTYT